MAQIRYIAPEGEPTHQTQWDIAFGPEFVEVTDQEAIRRAKRMPVYEVIDDDEPETGSTEIAKPDGVVTPPPGAGDPNELKAVHRGRGSYSIMRGDTEIKGGVDKAEADMFNALSAEDKAAYVATE